MQDQRRRGQKGDLLNQAIERVIAKMLADVPPEEHVGVLRRLSREMGFVLVYAPPQEGRIVEDMALRARLAAAIRVMLPEGINPVD